MNDLAGLAVTRETFEVKLQRIRRLSQSTLDFRFVKTDGCPVEFEAGQFFRFRFVDGDGEFERSYSLCNFADEVAESKKDSLITTVYRKYEHHKMKSQLIDESFTATLAESKSIEAAKKLMEEETTTEHISYLHKLKLSQYNRVVDDITQRLSFIRDDKNYHKSINN